VGIWDDAHEPFPGAVSAGEPSPPASSEAGTWGAQGPDPATLLLQERTAE